MQRERASQAWLWQNESLSDVRLQLCIVQPTPEQATCDSPDPHVDHEAGSTSHGGRFKVARRSGDGSAPEAATAAAAASTAVTVGCARSFPLHALILASSSAYFRARTTQSSGALRYAAISSGSPGADAAGGSGGGAGARCLLLVEHVEEGELDAMEAVLRHCYTDELCHAGGDPANLTIEVLLQMLTLSDRFDVPLCTLHCCEELSQRRSAEHFDVDTINAVLGSLPPGVHACPLFQDVLDLATERLLQLLGDADAVSAALCNSVWANDGDAALLAAQLRQLSLPALLALLGSDDLQARSENSVLMVANTWVACAPAAAACGDAELRQVAATLRLCCLTHSFLFDVLPKVPWLKMSTEEREALIHYTAAVGAGRPEPTDAAAAAGTLSRRALLLRDGLLPGPPAWYSIEPRADCSSAGEEVDIEWDMGREELHQLLLQAGRAGRATALSRECVLNGFTLHMCLSVKSVPCWHAALSVRVCTQLGGSAASFSDGAGGVEGVLPVACRAVHAEMWGGIKVRGVDHGSSRAKEGAHSDSAPLLSLSLTLLPRSRQLLDVASWEPYLVPNGKLSMVCNVGCCE